MKIPMVIDVDISIEEWARVAGYRIEDGKFISTDNRYSFSKEDFEECIREWVRTAVFFADPDGFWLMEKYFSDPDEQAVFVETLVDNYVNLMGK